MYMYMKYKTEPLPFFEFGCIFQACMGQTCTQGKFLNSQINIPLYQLGYL